MTVSGEIFSQEVQIHHDTSVCRSRYVSNEPLVTKADFDSLIACTYKPQVGYNRRYFNNGQLYAEGVIKKRPSISTLLCCGKLMIYKDSGIWRYYYKEWKIHFNKNGKWYAVYLINENQRQKAKNISPEELLRLNKNIKNEKHFRSYFDNL